MNPPVLHHADGERLTDAEFRAMVALHGGEALTQALLHLRAVVSAASTMSMTRLIVEAQRARLFLDQHSAPMPPEAM
jgi:hypothetical protein